MQRWALILSGFDYTIEYVKGVHNEADAISRMPQQIFEYNNEEFSYVNLVESENHVNISFKDIARETRRDPILSRVAESVLDGTLCNLKDDKFTPYREKYTQLGVEHGCVLWGYRTIIPEKFKNTILYELHSSHLGIVKTKALVRS